MKRSKKSPSKILMDPEDLYLESYEINVRARADMSSQLATIREPVPTNF